MIVFDLQCRSGAHRFEGWFGSSDDFERQRERGLVGCPVCGSVDVIKSVMAPNVGRKGNQLPEPARSRDPARQQTKSAAAEPVTAGGMPAPAPGGPAALTNAGPALPPEAAALFRAIAARQAEALKSSRWVGNDFADSARAMHYGETDTQAIHGQATPTEARELLEEGIEVAPILFPVIPPNEAN
ncbi:MAG: DUF1178 family protein [Pseudomonadota bacterium]